MLDWFTTIPGILIICGVILLVIAIILFIAGNKKSKKEVSGMNSTVDNTMNTITNTNNTVVDTVASTPNVDSMQVSSETNSTPSVTVVEETPAVESVNATPSIAIEEPVQIQEPQQMVTEANSTIMSEPVIENATIDIPTVTEMPVKEENTMVYGTDTPVVDFTPSVEKPVTIYGGNDPLEATQTLPKMDEHHEPYGGAYPEARIIDSNPSIEMPTPVEEVVSEMPAMEPTVENTVNPSVIEIPDFESVSADIPAVNSTIVEETPVVSPVAMESEPVSIPTVEEKSNIIEEL